METTFIYTLSDKDGNIRYIGKTSYIKQRLYAHIRETKSNRISHKINWIKSLLNNNERPIIEILDEVPIDDWQLYEAYWIEQFRQWGFILTNQTSGGDGGSGYIHTAESKEKMRQAKLGTTLSEEQKNKISLSVKKKANENPYYNRGLGNSKNPLDKDVLYNLYIIENISMPKISEILGVSETTIFRNLKDFGIEKDKSIWKKQCANSRIPESRVVLQYDKKGNFIREWVGGCSEIYKETGIKAQRVCSGARKTSGGFIWKYKI